jgi:hypothetical protein
MDDMSWYARERINDAYQFAENRRLAREAQRTRPIWSVNPQRLKWLIRTLLKSKLDVQPAETASVLSPAPER